MWCKLKANILPAIQWKIEKKKEHRKVLHFQKTFGSFGCNNVIQAVNTYVRTPPSPCSIRSSVWLLLNCWICIWLILAYFGIGECYISFKAAMRNIPAKFIGKLYVWPFSYLYNDHVAAVKYRTISIVKRRQLRLLVSFIAVIFETHHFVVEREVGWSC